MILKLHFFEKTIIKIQFLKWLCDKTIIKTITAEILTKSGF